MDLIESFHLDIKDMLLNNSELDKALRLCNLKKKIAVTFLETSSNAIFFKINPKCLMMIIKDRRTSIFFLKLALFFFFFTNLKCQIIIAFYFDYAVIIYSTFCSLEIQKLENRV